MSVCWNTFIAVTTWESIDLDMILENGDQPFKSLNQCRLLRGDHLPRIVNIYSNSVDVFLLNNTTGEITLTTYLVSLKNIEGCLNIGSRALFIISAYIFGLIWKKDFTYFTYLVYLFDSHSKDYEGNISQNDFETLNDNSSVLDVQIILSLRKPLIQN